MARRALLRLGKIILLTAGSLVALVLTLLGLVFAGLAFPPLRAFAVQKGVAYTNEHVLEGMALRVARVDRLDPWGVSVRDIRLFDEQKRELVRVPWVSVRLNPFSLIHNSLTLRSVEIDGVRAHLYPASTEPKPEEPEEPPSEPSSFTIRADRVRIRDAALTTDWSGRTLHAVVGTLALAGKYGPKPALALSEATVRVTANDEELLRLRTREGAFDADQGGRVALEAMLAGAPLTLRAEVPALDELAPWPLRRAELRIRGLDRRALERLGVPDGAELATKLDLTLSAQTKADALHANVALDAGKGRVELAAQVDDDAYDLTVSVAPTLLSSVAGILPATKVRGALHAHATPGYDPDATSLVPERAELEWSNVVVDDARVPAGLVRAELPLPVIRLLSLTLAGFENALAVQGEYDTETQRGRAALDFRELELNHLDVLQQLGLAGLVDGGISASFAPNSIAARGDLKLLEFVHPSAQLHQLGLGFAITGSPSAPEGTLRLEIEQLKAGQLALDRVDANAEATLRTLAAKLEVKGPDSQLSAEIGGQRTPNGQMRVQGIGRGTVASKDLRFDLRELWYGENGVTLQELSLYSDEQALRVNGSLDQKQNLVARLNVSNVDLAEWTSLAGVDGIAGRLDGWARASGTTDAPRIDSTFELKGAQLRSELPIDAKLRMRGDLGTRRADATLTLRSSDEPSRSKAKQLETSEPLEAKVDVSVIVPKRPLDLSKAIAHAKLETYVDAHMPIEPLSALAGDKLAGLQGVLDLTLAAEGTLDAPKLETDLRLRLKLPEAEDEAKEALRLTANVTRETAKVALWTGDEQGELLLLNGDLDWPGGNPRAALAQPERWKDARFSLHTELRPRRLDTMQGVFAYFSKLYAVSLPLRAGAKVTLSGDHGKLDGSAQVQAVIFGDRLDGRCALGAQSAVDLDARLAQDDVEVGIDIRTDGGGTVKGKLDATLALNAFGGGEPVFGPAKLTLAGKKIAIHKLPGLCNLAGGSASFDLTAQGLGKQAPELDLSASISDLRAVNAPAVSMDAKARVGGKSAELSAELSSQGRQFGSVRAKVPLSYPTPSMPTVLPNAPIDAHVRFDQLPLANALAFTEAVGSVRGSASANIAVSGKLNDPYPEGFVQLDDVHLSVASIAQPIHDIDGRVEIKGRSAKIPKLTARDRGGKLSVEGYLSLREDLQGDGGLYLEADKFPLRQQGTIIGELTTRARLDVKIPQDLKARAELKILDGRIWLTGERGKSVQSLDPHPDIRFADEKVEHDATPAEEKAAGKGIALASFTIRTERELWLMHEDFSIQAGVDITLLEDEDGPTLQGEATIHRGELKLMGKPLKLEKDSAIRFTGPMPPDPELDIRAIYDPPTGENLIVHVTGRGSAPVLEFSGAATNAGEAVAVLTGVGSAQSRNSDSQATNEMARLASSMTAGLLIMTARREFGDWVPMISIDTGASGEPTSARAGFDASKLIPSWLSGVAKGAYVEGIVGAAGTSQSGGSVGVGVRLEVALPRDLVTTIGYGPGPGWSTDIAWSP